MVNSSWKLSAVMVTVMGMICSLCFVGLTLRQGLTDVNS